MKRFQGIAAAPGIATAPAFVYLPGELVIHKRKAADPGREWQRCQDAVAMALQDLADLRARTAVEAGESEAAIFDAHQMMITDPELEDELQAEINAGASAEFAVKKIFDLEVERFESMDDPYFRERAVDFADVSQRLLRLLLGVEENALSSLSEPVIVVAWDLLPSDTALMDRSLVRGFCTAHGGPLSHTAILARNLGLPAVVGIGDGLMELEGEESIIVDGISGVVIVDADEAHRATYLQRMETASAIQDQALAACLEPAITLDGRRVEVVANVGLPGEEAEALKLGAEGIGLLRTEFLFVGRKAPPAEDEQVRAYRPILEAMGQRPAIARTLDIGGDKPADFLEWPREDNPFLGWRAIRISLEQTGLFKTQLRALLRAGYGCNLKIMFPMIATVGELEAAREMLDRARSELDDEGLPAAEAVEVGTMIEIPAAALMADHLSGLVDFFSIGSNDLTQYTLAADRGNPSVASILDSLDPAVLRLVDRVIRAADAAGIWVGMCGEMAGDPLAIPILLGLGLDEFSMGPAAVPIAKALIRRLSTAETQRLAQEALKQATAAGVRALVNPWLEARDLAGWNA